MDYKRRIFKLFIKTKHIKCPYCKDPINDQEKAIRCNSCDTPYHVECFTNGCLTYGCKSATKHFFVKWSDSPGIDHFYIHKILSAKAFAELVSNPEVKVGEKTDIKDPAFEGLWWVASMEGGKPQPLSTFGLLRAIAKYGEVDYWSGPYKRRMDVEGYIDGFYWDTGD